MKADKFLIDAAGAQTIRQMDLSQLNIYLHAIYKRGYEDGQRELAAIIREEFEKSKKKDRPGGQRPRKYPKS